MGIRYYAYPLAPEHVDRARIDPYPFLSDDPLADAWELNGRRRPDMLYLDTCWGELQRLTCPDPGGPRPAYALVRGAVTRTGMGWIPWVDVLPPSDVDDVARDLALIDEDDVATCVGRDGEPLSSSERGYVTYYLRHAQDFTARLQRRGWGLVYMIG
ncbi:hypothetical protein [Georgenia sp. H159]|uniref:hypothetical protein n=1 Tax=Georgenia sp. H159 TaxID=3076115 RepID=UPI002D79CB67|nr:hypothetical protein [Georgenia sp. H159]